MGGCFSLGVRQRWIGGAENESPTQCDGSGGGGDIGGSATQHAYAIPKPHHPPNPPRKQIGRRCPAKASIPGGFAPFPRWICRLVFSFFGFSRTASKLNLGGRQSTNALPPHATRTKPPLYLFLLVEWSSIACKAKQGVVVRRRAPLNHPIRFVIVGSRVWEMVRVCHCHTSAMLAWTDGGEVLRWLAGRSPRRRGEAFLFLFLFLSFLAHSSAPWL